MKRHTKLDDGVREKAALYSLSALPRDEAAAYEAHIANCPACADEVAALRSVLSDISLLAPRATPSSGLRSRVMKRLREHAARGASLDRSRFEEASRPWRTASATALEAGFSYALASEGAWQATGFPGIEARQLFVDTASDRVTMLVRMAPGTSYPSHRHTGREECYVIQGDLRAGGLRMNAGDYKFAEIGSIDTIQSTEHGCVLLIASSQHDELLP